MADYFAHAAYGVLVDSDDHVQLLNNLIQKTMDEYDCDRVRDALKKARDKYPVEYNQIRRLVGGPPDACFIYTDDEDDHAGRSATSPDQFILGYGLFVFPRTVDEDFQRVAKWHMWVTA